MSEKKTLKRKADKNKLTAKRVYESSILTILIFFISLFLISFGSSIYNSLTSYFDLIGLSLVLFTIGAVVLIVIWVFFLISRDLDFVNYVIFPLAYVGLFWISIYKRDSIFMEWYVFLPLIIILWSTQFLRTFSKKIPRQKPIIIIFLLTAMLLIGVSVIGGITNQRTDHLDFSLNKCDTNQKYKFAEVSCKDKYGKVLIGSNIDCVLRYVRLENISGFVDIDLLNETTDTQEFKNGGMRIVGKEDVVSIFIRIEGYEENKKICLSSGYPFTFKSAKQFDDDRRNFFTYLGAFLIFIFVSVPSAYKGWKELFMDK